MEKTLVFATLTALIGRKVAQLIQIECSVPLSKYSNILHEYINIASVSHHTCGSIDSRRCQWQTPNILILISDFPYISRCS